VIPVVLIPSALLFDLPTLYLVRHGDTAWTEAHRHTGLTDLPLNERGEAHARLLGERLRGIAFARVFTSPLQRAARTCELCGFGAVAELDPDLLEWDYGRWEGRHTGDIMQQWPGWELFRDGCPDGESPQDVAHRADRFVARVHGIVGNVLAFSSGHIIRTIAARWLRLPPVVGRCFFCEPASVGVLSFEHESLDEPTIGLWNHVAQVKGDHDERSETGNGSGVNRP
jgi:broad specificity phosphatase PhoE